MKWTTQQVDGSYRTWDSKEDPIFLEWFFDILDYVLRKFYNNKKLKDVICYKCKEPLKENMFERTYSKESNVTKDMEAFEVARAVQKIYKCGNCKTLNLVK